RVCSGVYSHGCPLYSPSGCPSIALPHARTSQPRVLMYPDVKSSKLGNMTLLGSTFSFILPLLGPDYFFFFFGGTCFFAAAFLAFAFLVLALAFLVLAFAFGSFCGGVFLAVAAFFGGCFFF